MKRLLSLTMILAFSLALLGCGGSEQVDTKIQEVQKQSMMDGMKKYEKKK